MDSSTRPQPPADLPVTFIPYGGESHLPSIQALIDRDLSEPYSVFTYRYFLNQWPQLCFLAVVPEAHSQRTVGVVVCKLDEHETGAMRGYIAMLAVLDSFRGAGLGTRLVRAAIRAMSHEECDEVVLEAEVTNTAALKLYEQLGFIRDKLLEKYYLNGNGAYRLKLRLKPLNVEAEGGGMADD